MPDPISFIGDEGYAQVPDRPAHSERGCGPVTRKREFLDYLADIQDAARSISQFIVGMTWTQFAWDKEQ